MGDSAVVVGYGPETTETTGISQIRQKIEPQWVCDGLYTPENAAITQRDDIKIQVDRDLPNLFSGESVICAADAFNDAKGIFEQNGLKK